MRLCHKDAGANLKESTASAEQSEQQNNNSAVL